MVATIELWPYKLYENGVLQLYGVQCFEISWDGKMAGEEMPKGVYLYTLWVEYEDGHRERLSGELLLMR